MVDRLQTENGRENSDNREEEDRDSGRENEFIGRHWTKRVHRQTAGRISTQTDRGNGRENRHSRENEQRENGGENEYKLRGVQLQRQWTK